MSKGLSILAGVGQGLMAGSQFMAQQRERDENRKFNTARLGMLEEQHGWAREDRAAQQVQQTAMRDYQQLFGEVAGELGAEASMEQISAETLKRGLANGRIPQSQMAELFEKAGQLRKAGVLQDLRLGNLEGLRSKLSQLTGRNMAIDTAPGRDEFGNEANIYRVLGEDGTEVSRMTPAQLGMLFGADDMLTEQEAADKRHKLAAETRAADARAGASRAQADASRALAEQRRTGGANGRGSSPTTGFSAAAREEATRAALRRKVEAGDASAEEIDMLAVLEAQAERRDEASLPAGARAARHWSNASPEAVDREVERQLAEIRVRMAGDPTARLVFNDPETVEALRQDIRRKIGAGDQQHVSPLRGDGAPDAPHGAANGRPAADPLAPNEKRPSLNTFFR